MWGAGILAAFLVISGTSALADESSIPEDVQALVEAGDCPGKAHEDFETPMTPSGSFDSFLEEMCEKDSKFCIDSHSYVKVRTLMRKYGGSGPSDPKVQSCKNLVYHHYCEQSPWKDLDVRERFEKMMEYSKKYAPQNGLPAALLPCIATAETTNLEPSYVHMKNCSHKEASAQGLGQFIYEPFFDDGLGLPNEAVKRMLAKKHLKPWMQERTQLTPDELKHRHPWAFKSTMEQYQKDIYTKHPWRMFYALSDDPEFQVEMLAHLLGRKADYSVVNRRRGVARWKELAKIYNSTKTVRFCEALGKDVPGMECYGSMVSKCQVCLEKGDSNFCTCLKMAHPDVQCSEKQTEKSCPWLSH